jgi:hypothetical protein
VRIAAFSSPELTDPARLLTTAGGAVAVLVLNAQATEREAAHDELADARDSYRQALSDEVGQMHEAASEIFWGAVVQGSLAIVGGAASVYGAARSQSVLSDALESHDQAALIAASKPCAVETFGSAVTTLAGPTGTLVSGSDGQHSLADAKAASGRGEQAKWRMDDAKSDLEESRALADHSLQWLSSATEKEGAATTSVLANMA